MSSAFAFAELSSKVTNNTSTVLLIRWKGKRLLFVGDAEWEAKFREGRANGGWNVMWHERKSALGEPIHFLKVGHHGSENATPWNESEEEVTEPGTMRCHLPCRWVASNWLPGPGFTSARTTRRFRAESWSNSADVGNVAPQGGTRQEGVMDTEVRGDERQWLDAQPWRTIARTRSRAPVLSM
jgi:hypothetical protein